MDRTKYGLVYQTPSCTLLLNLDLNMFIRALTLFITLTISAAYADSRLIIHLTDYLANDYSGAVSSDGKVLSELEYAEQVEFAQTALKAGKEDPTLNQNPELIQKLDNLNSSIGAKGSPEKVIPLAREIQRTVISVSGIALSPASWP